ncbi:MAG: hypothetical protein JZU47_03940, partial [Prolixibacteraceae bacterium]|nr:hypothetical protein [Prolixibacteraceae bacterium]
FRFVNLGSIGQVTTTPVVTPPVLGGTVLPDPGNLTAYRAQLGQTFSFRIRGHDAGTVWGGANGIYTDDSSLGKAAVHAGLLRIGEERVVTVTILGGQSSYTGNSQNGVTSINYGSFQFSFRFVTTGATTPVVTPTALGGTVLPDPGNLTAYRSRIGQTFSFRVKGTDAGSVWGGINGPYTDDSSLGKAAVHASLLKIGEEGIISVTILGGQPSYTGNIQNGITSLNYGSYQGSFRFVNLGSIGQVTTTPVVTPPVSVGTVLPDPGNLTAYRAQLGQTLSFRIRGHDAGTVWGGANGIYTDDSSLGKAAVHAGLLRIGEERVVTVTILGGQSSYTGNSQNGVTSINYGSFQWSFRFK